MKLKDKMNNQYSVIAGYVIATAVIIYCLGLIATNAPKIISEVLDKLSWVLRVAKPIVLGFIFAYLVEPVVTFFEVKLKNNKYFKKKGSCRTYGVIITLILVVIVVASIVSLLVYSVTDQLRLASLDDIIILSNALVKSITDFYNTVQTKLLDLDVESEELTKYIQEASTFLLSFFKDIC